MLQLLIFLVSFQFPIIVMTSCVSSIIFSTCVSSYDDASLISPFIIDDFKNAPFPNVI